MADPTSTPTFSALLQRFFVEHFGHQRAVSPRTVAAYRDTFRLLLGFAEVRIGKAPTALALVDLDARLILSFLDHLEKDRKNGARSRNARLAALRSFLKYAAHYDLTALPVIEQALAIPIKPKSGTWLVRRPALRERFSTLTIRSRRSGAAPAA